MKLTTENTRVELIGQLYHEGNLSRDEWSRTTPSLRKACMRYNKKLIKQHRKQLKGNLDNVKNEK